MTRREAVLCFLASAMALRAARPLSGPPDPSTVFPVSRTPAAWLAKLGPWRYWILRKQGTEPAWTSALLHDARMGCFACAGCGTSVFRSSDKYDSGTGWPSFARSMPEAVVQISDGARTEVHCAHCGGHLGHVFPDGPPPLGLRFCINGGALTFVSELR